MLERVLSIHENHYGQDHIKVGDLLNNLSDAYRALSDNKKQKELLEKSLAIEETHYVSDLFQVAIILGILGCAFGGLGDHQKKK